MMTVRIKTSSYWIKEGPKSSESVPIRDRKKEDTETQRRTPQEDRSRDWTDAATSPAAPRTAGNHRKLGEGTGRSALRASRRKQPCGHLDLGLLAS